MPFGLSAPTPVMTILWPLFICDDLKPRDRRGYPMNSRFAVVILLFAAALHGQPATPAPTADDVARRAFDVAGGPAWETARYFAFTFNLDRTDGTRAASFPQRWDRTTGDYRVSGVDPQGKKFDVTMNLRTGIGKATVD